MTTPVIIDIVVAAVLVCFVIYGGSRGLVRSLAGLVAVVIALVGAGMAAATFAPPAAEFVTPLIAEKIEERVEEAVASRTDSVQLPEVEVAEDLSVGELLAILGLDEEVRGQLSEKAESAVRDSGAAVVEAVVESVAHSFIYGVLYILVFLLLLLLVHVLIGAMDLVMKLPGLSLLNALGGALVGLVEGALLLFLAVWVLRRLGVSFETEALAEAHILSIFTANTPLGVLSLLQ